MSLRDQVGLLLLRLRGEESRTAFGRRLGVTRQSVMKLEAGGVSLRRLDELAPAYGVRFEVVAYDAVTGARRGVDDADVSRETRAQPPPATFFDRVDP